MNTKSLRKHYGVTQKELSEIFEIPLATVKNWDARDCMPEYMNALIAKFLYLREMTKKLRDAEEKMDFKQADLERYCLGTTMYSFMKVDKD